MAWTLGPWEAGQTVTGGGSGQGSPRLSCCPGTRAGFPAAGCCPSAALEVDFLFLALASPSFLRQRREAPTSSGSMTRCHLSLDAVKHKAPPSLWPLPLDAGDLCRGQGWWAKVMVWGPQPEQATSTIFFFYFKLNFKI